MATITVAVTLSVALRDELKKVADVEFKYLTRQGAYFLEVGVRAAKEEPSFRGSLEVLPPGPMLPDHHNFVLPSEVYDDLCGWAKEWDMKMDPFCRLVLWTVSRWHDKVATKGQVLSKEAFINRILAKARATRAPTVS